MEHRKFKTHKPAAAPAPQAEGTHSKKCLDQLYSSLNASCICGLDGLKVGAAPAETARPGHIAMNRDGTEGARSTPDMPKGHVIGETAGEMTAEQLGHTRSCPALTPGNDEYCTCGLRWRIALQTEQEMHAAWRKRAEESEAAEAFAKQRVEQAERALDDEIAERDRIIKILERLAQPTASGSPAEYTEAVVELTLRKLFEALGDNSVLRPQVADLERERDTLKEQIKSWQSVSTEANIRRAAAESELREMRERVIEECALEINRLAKAAAKASDEGVPMKHTIAAFCDARDYVRLLARKAGS